MESFSPIDFCILLILVASTFFGAWRGVVRTLFALAAAILATVASFLFTGKLAALLPYHATYPLITTLISFVVIFAGVLVLVSLPAAFFTKLLHATGMRFVDRSVGFVFGFLRGVVMILAMVWAVDLIPAAHSALSTSTSQLLPYFIHILVAIKPYLDRVSGIVMSLGA